MMVDWDDEEKKEDCRMKEIEDKMEARGNRGRGPTIRGR